MTMLEFQFYIYIIYYVEYKQNNLKLAKIKDLLKNY